MKLLNIGTNQKLGKKVGTLSRPVGPTCPKSCPFLETACYAERLEDRYRNVHANWSQSYDLTPEQWSQWAGRLRQELEQAKGKLKAIRIHVGGDFLQADGQIDHAYCLALVGTLGTVEGLPPVWAYTHAWRELAAFPAALTLLRGAMVLFASVHSPTEAQEALALGFRLALDPEEPVSAARSGFHEIHGVKALACPEQVKGHERVTCDSCGYCFRATETRHVAFYRH